MLHGTAGRPAPQSDAGPQPMHAGWHFVEWACELVGTAAMLLGGLSAVCLDFAPGSPVVDAIPSFTVRLLLTGVLFAGAGSLVAISPPGRRSGAHLNPAVTLAFWLQRHVHEYDLGGYVVAQVLGGLLGVGVARLLWRSWLPAVDYAKTDPGRGLTALETVLVEAAMTTLVLLVIFAMVSHPRLARFTPAVLWVVIAMLVWRVAPYTGTSLNPARSFAPALFASDLSHLWIYLVGPLLGSFLAVAAWAGLARRRLLTAKLFHDPRYVSTMRTALPSRAAG